MKQKSNKTPIKDYKVNLTTLKKLVKLPSLCKRHIGNIGNKILPSKKSLVDKLKKKMDRTENQVSEPMYRNYPKNAEQKDKDGIYERKR